MILYHYSTRYGELFGHLKQPYGFDFKYGFYGVQLFFIISGFVIFMTLDHSKNIQDFIYKRFVRLYPAYWFGAFLTFSIVRVFSLPGREISFRHFVVNLTMLQKFFGVASVDSAYWSLAVELTFYFLISLLAAFKLLDKAEWMAFLWVLLAAAVQLLSRFNTPLTALLQSLLIPDYCVFFIAGMMFYRLSKKNTPLCHAVIFTCLLYELVFSGFLPAGIFAAFIGVFYLLIHHKLGFLNNKALLFIGTISYSLYLIHQNIGYVILRFLEKIGLTSEWAALIPMAIVMGLAAGMTFFIEVPTRRILKNWSVKVPLLNR